MKILWPTTPARLSSDDPIYVRYAALPYFAIIFDMHLQMVHFPTCRKVWLSSVWLPCAKPGNEVEYRIYEGLVTSPVLFSAVCAPVHEILGRCRRPLVVSNSTPLPDCLCHGSFRRYSPIKYRSRRRTEQRYRIRFFGPNFWEEQPRHLYGKLLARFTVRSLAKFGWVPFADLRLRNQSFDILRRCRKPLVVLTHFLQILHGSQNG